MKPVIRNILAIIAGVFLGSLINMGIITYSGYIIPPPEGADVTTMEGLKASLHLFRPIHFLPPFLAHALGTFVGAVIAAFAAATHKMKMALAVAIFFLVGGIANAFLLPAPVWFIALDLVLAYIPMGIIAAKIADRKN